MTPDDLDEFLGALDRLGGVLDTWPPQVRAQAESALADSAEARTHLAAMQRAEAVLAATRRAADPAPDDMAGRAIRSAQARPQQIVKQRLSWAAAGMLALVAGLYVGSIPRNMDNPSDVVTAALDPAESHDVW
jgi:hypothetical protein